jgi:hypothetical protein
MDGSGLVSREGVVHEERLESTALNFVCAAPRTPDLRRGCYPETAPATSTNGRYRWAEPVDTVTRVRVYGVTRVRTADRLCSAYGVTRVTRRSTQRPAARLEVVMVLREATFRGFVNPNDPTTHELRTWAYQPGSLTLGNLPSNFDQIAASDGLIEVIFDLATDPGCPARRFALHCLYLYAANGIRSNFRAHPRRKLRKFVERAEAGHDDVLALWARNTRMLLARPEIFRYPDWCEGGLVREPRRIG